MKTKTENRQALKRLDLDMAEQRINLTKVMNEWAEFTRYEFKPESPYVYLNFLRIYTPPEGSIDQPIFIRRGHFGLYILDELEMPASLTESVAGQILFGFASIWKEHYANMEQYLIQTAIYAKAEELEAARMLFSVEIDKAVEAFNKEALKRQKEDDAKRKQAYDHVHDIKSEILRLKANLRANTLAIEVAKNHKIDLNDKIAGLKKAAAKQVTQEVAAEMNKLLEKEAEIQRSIEASYNAQDADADAATAIKDKIKFLRDSLKATQTEMKAAKSKSKLVIAEIKKRIGDQLVADIANAKASSQFEIESKIAQHKAEILGRIATETEKLNAAKEKAKIKNDTSWKIKAMETLRFAKKQANFELRQEIQKIEMRYTHRNLKIAIERIVHQYNLPENY